MSDQNAAGPLVHTQSRRVSGFQYAPLRFDAQPVGFSEVRFVDALQVSPGQGITAATGKENSATPSIAPTIAFHSICLHITNSLRYFIFAFSL